MNNNPTFILKEDNPSVISSVKSEIIGLSEQRRSLVVTYLGGEDVVDSPLKIFVMAGQHGDEKYGRKAANRLITSLAMSFNIEFPLMRLAILSDANPDGSYQKTRTNSIGTDLNRDHQRLDSEETRTIHSFVRSWRPDLVIDVHNYPSRSKHLLAKNLIHYDDIFLDIPTNPAANHPLDKDKINDLLGSVQSDLKSLNFNCDRYVLVRPSGRVRHSTADVTDARNSLSLRYNTLTVLLEGRNPTRQEGQIGKEHIISAQYHALYAILKWTHQHGDYFMHNKKGTPSEKDRVAIRSKYRQADQPLKMNFKNSITKRMDVVTLPNYAPDFQVTKYVELPAAYAIPLDKTKVIEILRRHGFTYQFSNASKVEQVEYYNIVQSVEPSASENRSKRKIVAVIKTEEKRLDKHAIFPVNQEGGHSLAVFLEPRSKYGLHKYNDLGLLILPDSQYPILRVLQSRLDMSYQKNISSSSK